jgi:SAM-dependent methyltransferase
MGYLTIFLLLALLVMPGTAEAQYAMSQNLAPFVPSPQSIVERMLEVARLKPGETLYDLGCGDGRVLITAAQKFGARAVGIEISERLAKQSSDQIQKLNLQNLVKVRHANLLDEDFSDADVVTLYLLRDSNDTVRPKLEKSLHPGARVVSHDYEIRGWKPTAVDRTEAHRRHHVIYLYEMPPRK